jgi:ParB family chromosome partitioning protein
MSNKVNAFAVNPNDLVLIGLDTEDTDAHPLFDERVLSPIDENFVRNVALHGILEPVIVRQNGESLEVVAGRQRVRAAREANIRLAEQGKEPVLVPCMAPKKGSDSDLFGISVSENEIRKDDSPAQKAAKANRLIALLGGEGPTSIAQAAIIFGVSQQTVRNWLALSGLASEVQDMVHRGELTATSAIQLAPLSTEEQISAAASLLSSEDRPTTERARAARNNQRRDPQERDESFSTRPSIRVLKRVAKGAQADRDANIEGGISDDAYNMLRFVLGELSPTRIKGLAGLLHRAEMGE